MLLAVVKISGVELCDLQLGYIVSQYFFIVVYIYTYIYLFIYKFICVYIYIHKYISLYVYIYT